MKLKITKLIVAAAVLSMAFAVTSCKKNDVKTIEVDNSFAFSIFNDDSITIAKLLDGVDSAWRETIHVDENGVMSIMRNSDTVRDVITGRELLSDIDDVNVDVDTSVIVPELNVPDSLYIVKDLIGSIPPGTPIPPFEYRFSFDTLVNLNRVAAFTFNVENFIIEEVHLKSGIMAFNFDLHVDNILRIIIYLESENVFKDTEHLNMEFENKDDVSFDMADWSIRPVDDTVVFSAHARFLIEETIINENTPLEEIQSLIDGIINVSGEKTLTIDGGFTGINLKMFTGYADIEPQEFRGIIDSLTFNITQLQGDLSLKTPGLYVNYMNTFGLNIFNQLDSLYYKNKEGEEVNLLVNSPTSFTMYQTEEGVFNEYDLSSNLVPFIDVLGGADGFGYKGNATVDGGYGTITEDSHIDITANLEIPVSCKINEAIYMDTIDISLGDSINITNYLDEIELKFRVKNGLPLQIALQLYTCDSTLLQTGEYITDSLFKKQGANVIGSSFGGSVVNSTLYATATGTSMNNILKANKLILKVSASTNGQPVDIKANDIIGIGIGLKTKTTNVNL